MLSDSIRETRHAVRAGAYQEISVEGFVLTLQAYELEARNMEERILMLSGRQHVPLDGMLVSRPEPVIDISRIGAAR